MSRKKELEKAFREVMGETVHTAFRKGTEDISALKVWDAIHVMPVKAWGEVLDWICWCLAETVPNNMKLVKKE